MFEGVKNIFLFSWGSNFEVKFIFMKYLFVVIFLGSLLKTDAQPQEAVTEEGKTVILNEDGTWQYTTETKFNCNFEINEADEFAGTSNVLMKRERIGKNKDVPLNVKVGRVNSNYIVHAMYSGDLGCVNDESSLMIKLVSGKMVKLLHKGETKCGKNAPLLFELTAEDFTVLLASPVSIIRVQGPKYSADVNVIEVADYFMKNLKCASQR